MDVDAEMRKLQEEARRVLAARAESEEPAPELPPTPVPAPARTEERGGIGGLLEPEALREAAALAERAQGLRKLSLKAKLAWGIGGLLAFFVAWELFLGKLVWALISIAALVLLVLVILRMLGFLRSSPDDEDEDADEEPAEE